MPVRATFALLFALFFTGPGTQTLQVVPLARDGEVLVSFKLDQPLTDDIRSAIHSGLLVKFLYTVELRRASAVWFDRKISDATVGATVKYDNLTRVYHVTRSQDGHTNWAEDTSREDEAWKWLTSDFARMPLFHGVQLEQNAEYYVRVSANASPHNRSFIWPWSGDDAVGLAKFTFVK